VPGWLTPPITHRHIYFAGTLVVGLTNGGPGTATTSVAMEIFSGFFNGDYAYQMANAVIFFVMTMFLAVFQLGVMRRRGGVL